LALQSKTKSARFVDGVHFASPALKLGRPVQEGLLIKTLRRFGISAALLHHHHVKILVHINPKLDATTAAIKLAAGSLV